MAKSIKTIKDTKKSFISPFQEYWTKKNYLLLGSGLAVLILGYFLMAQAPWDGFASMNLSPIILLVAYLVIIPLSILFKTSSSKK